MGKIISIANQKGGVGKTTTAVNLSAALAHRGRKVIVVDLDPQGNATSGLGVSRASVEASLYDVFMGVFNLPSIVVATQTPSLWVAPSDPDLVGIEIQLAPIAGRETILKRQLDRLASLFDFVFFDCPPSLSLLTVNALVASNSILVPLQCEYYALEGISALVKTIEIAREQLNPSLELEGVLLTMFDARTNLSRQVADEAKDFFKEKVYDTVIPRNVRLSESPSFGKPIISYDPNSIGARAYLDLADEFLLRQLLQDGDFSSGGPEIQEVQLARISQTTPSREGQESVKCESAQILSGDGVLEHSEVDKVEQTRSLPAIDTHSRNEFEKCGLTANE